MPKKLMMWSAAAAACLMTAATASATTYKAVYTGTVSSGYDLTGLFTTPDTSLAGLSYKEVFTIDTAMGSLMSTAQSEQVFGGSSFGLSDPVTATITINGKTVSLGSASFAIARTGASAGQYQIYDDVQSASFDANGSVNNYIAGGITTDASGIVPTSFSSKGYLIPVDGVVVKDLGSAFLFHTIDKTGKDVVDTYGVLSPTSAAPEPGTWALMFGGIAMIGGMLRIAHARRRENEVAGIATA